MSSIQYGIKDLTTGEYFSGRGHAMWHISGGNFNTNIDAATLYGAKGPVTSFINSFNKALDTPRSQYLGHSISRDLVCVEIEVSLKEME